MSKGQEGRKGQLKCWNEQEEFNISEVVVTSSLKDRCEALLEFWWTRKLTLDGKNEGHAWKLARCKQVSSIQIWIKSAIPKWYPAYSRWWSWHPCFFKDFLPSNLWGRWTHFFPQIVFFQRGLCGKNHPPPFRPCQTKFFGAEKISWTIRAADPLSPEDKTQQSEIAAQAIFFLMRRFEKRKKGFEYGGHYVCIYTEKMKKYIHILLPCSKQTWRWTNGHQSIPIANTSTFWRTVC